MNADQLALLKQHLSDVYVGGLNPLLQPAADAHERHPMPPAEPSQRARLGEHQRERLVEYFEGM